MLDRAVHLRRFGEQLHALSGCEQQQSMMPRHPGEALSLHQHLLRHRALQPRRRRRGQERVGVGGGPTQVLPAFLLRRVEHTSKLTCFSSH